MLDLIIQKSSLFCPLLCAMGVLVQDLLDEPVALVFLVGAVLHQDRGREALQGVCKGANLNGGYEEKQGDAENGFLVPDTDGRSDRKEKDGTGGMAQSPLDGPRNLVGKGGK